VAGYRALFSFNYQIDTAKSGVHLYGNNIGEVYSSRLLSAAED